MINIVVEIIEKHTFMDENGKIDEIFCNYLYRIMGCADREMIIRMPIVGQKDGVNIFVGHFLNLDKFVFFHMEVAWATRLHCSYLLKIGVTTG